MKAKLIKVPEGYLLQELPKKGTGGASCEGTLGSNYGEGAWKLSKQNCDELFGVVNVEKLAENKYGKGIYEIEQVDAYVEGFNKAMELNKDKMFTSEDMKNAYTQGTNDGAQFESMQDYDYEEDNEPWEFTEEAEKKFIDSLQQPTEIEVEIEMTTAKVELSPNDVPIEESDGMTITKMFKLDPKGCLMLKKI
jgi:hypothetical protein